jgi:uncharacterized protein
VPTAARPPADWYPDPSGAHQHRYWDGERWTDGVADDGVVTEDPLDPAGAEAAWDELRDHRARWPGWVAVAAVGGMVAGVVVAVALAVAVDLTIGGDLPVVIASVVGLYGTLLATCVAVGRRLGTPRGLFADFGLRIRWADVGWGLLLGLLARVVSVLVVLPFILIDEDLGGSNLPSEEDLGGDVSLAIAFFVMAVLVAPFVEEIFFRGLLQRSLETSLPAWVAIGLASILFGLAHASIELGSGNVAVIAATAAGGAVFGITARRFRRLGPAITAHAWFNLPAALVLFFLV